MKTIIAVLLLAILSLSSRAQQQSSMVYSNALKKTMRLQKAGTVITLVGGLTLFTGSYMYHKAYDDAGSESVPKNKIDTARSIMFGGLGCLAVGVPVLTIGRTKERHLRIEAGIFKTGKEYYAGGIGVKFRF
ncbi:MAG TPA: hypothetical protein VJ963_06730 [Bacteroidales bacterium]|nr:hypothetical protein [Bacteroidales bacterium]